MSFVIAILISFGLTPIAGIAGRPFGLLDRPQDETLEIHSRPVPILGGPAVVASTFIAAAVTGTHVSGWTIIAVVIALFVGVIDDAHPLAPTARLAGLAAAGVALAMRGGQLPAFGVLARPAIVVLVMASANAVNLVDGQNGLAGGLAAAAALGLAGVGGGGSHALALAFAGGVLGFVLWNIPGLVFLGNGGAYAVGTMLAALATDAASSHGWRVVVAAGVCLGVFAFELVFTIVRRFVSGASLTSGDRLHAYDLVSARRGRMVSTAAFCAAGLAIAGAATGLSRTSVRLELPITLAMGAVAALWGRHLWSSRIDRTRRA